MPGAFSSTSRAVLPLATMLFSTLITVRSTCCSMNGFLATTLTSFRFFVSSAIVRTGTVTPVWSTSTANGRLYVLAYPTCCAPTRYWPGVMFSNVYTPAALLTAPFTRAEESAAFTKSTVANSRGSPAVVFTCPLMVFLGVVCAGRDCPKATRQALSNRRRIEKVMDFMTVFCFCCFAVQARVLCKGK